MGEIHKIDLKPSRILAALLAGGHSIIAVSLWPLALPFWLTSLLTALLASSLAFYMRRDALLTARAAIIGVEIEDGRKCRVQLKSGDWKECVLLDTSFVSPYLTILNLRPEGARFARHAVILRDSLSIEEFRRLRVWLRWKCAKKQA